MVLFNVPFPTTFRSIIVGVLLFFVPYLYYALPHLSLFFKALLVCAIYIGAIRLVSQWLFRARYHLVMAESDEKAKAPERARKAA